MVSVLADRDLTGYSGFKFDFAECRSKEAMRFNVHNNPPAHERRRAGEIYLVPTSWDDWYKFATEFAVYLASKDGGLQRLGETKIGRKGLRGAKAAQEIPEGFRRPRPPEEFEQLPEEFFSLGQDRSFYENLMEHFEPHERDEFLVGLRDIAFDQELLLRFKDEDVTQTSLLRSVPLPTVRGQFARLARGAEPLTKYHLKHAVQFGNSAPVPIDFKVTPQSFPPTNIHVIVGRNGVGKSTFLAQFAQAMCETSADAATLDGGADIANVVSVSFSAFDSFRPLASPESQGEAITKHYVGLRDPESPETIRGNEELQNELVMSARVCLQGARRERWVRGLRILEADPLFRASGLSDMADDPEFGQEEKIDGIAKIFSRLSSGHAIVFLTFTKLVETVEEKSLVLIDEPEGHLHPPLLSAFIRALSDLLVNRNALAIVATHSPVVLQEVPRSCVWKFYRSGGEMKLERPEEETFGENVGTLTNEVFKLEVSSTGFHRMLGEAILEHSTYEAVLAALKGQLGFEGRAVLRAMEYAIQSGQDVDS